MNAATAYDPTSPVSRRTLAVSIHRALVTNKFKYIPRGVERGEEVVYVREVGDWLAVRVYSSIDWNTGKARETGKDAIRAVATYTTMDGKVRGIVKATRVHRTGNIEDIVKRMVARAKSVFEKTQSPARCSACGSPTFVSKKGNDICAELCWTKTK